ncbi:hypothetical protein PV08_11786 [Exophiala spinifera]|uniref:Zn(2)-C6 fungal-type domain-containing protein n=1 Tax=Exophiala spinifera TaxID=91928 RepID=A0A0D2AU95_9EURO|nr:uncharacterized protein PV08_11786 [Exophiala spinifera]KIW10010.1 hypothetical protein PV08_11786 [Exophiala spinifera]
MAQQNTSNLKVILSKPPDWQTCADCKRAKAKCEPAADPQSCLRCQSKARPCIRSSNPHGGTTQSNRRNRKKRSDRVEGPPVEAGGSRVAAGPGQASQALSPASTDTNIQSNDTHENIPIDPRLLEADQENQNKDRDKGKGKAKAVDGDEGEGEDQG